MILVLFFLAEVAAVSMITTSESLSETATLLRSEFQQWADTGTPSPENRTCQTSTNVLNIESKETVAKFLSAIYASFLA